MVGAARTRVPRLVGRAARSGLHDPDGRNHLPRHVAIRRRGRARHRCPRRHAEGRLLVVVFPVITGRSGRERIYDGYPDVALEMIGSRTFDGRIQLLEYVPTILPGPPGNNTA